MLHKFLASLLALFTLAFCPAAFAGSYGEVQLAPSYKATYSATSAYFTPAAATTDVGIQNGSASKTIKVLKILMTYQGVGAGSPALDRYFIIKRSTADTAGTPTTLTNVPLDSANAAGSSVVKSYTANPTLGTTVGTVTTGAVAAQMVSGGGTLGAGPQVLFDADKYGQAIVLRGTAEGLAINFNGTIPSVSTPQLQFTYVWTEE